jgi:hypothetical protein
MEAVVHTVEETFLRLIVTSAGSAWIEWFDDFP